MENSSIQMFVSTANSDSTGVISAKPLCDFFGLDWSNQQKMFKNDPHLALLMVKKPSVAEDGKMREMVHFTKKGFLRWVQLINPNTVREEFRARFLEYQSSIFDFFYGSMEEQEQIRLDYIREAEIDGLFKSMKVEKNEIDKRRKKYLNNRFGQLSMF